MSFVQSLFGLEGRIALVTGGGQGLGKSMALTLAKAGAHVAVLARSENKIAKTVREIEALGRRGMVVPGDMTEYETCQEAVHQVERQLGPIDIVVNAAGTIDRTPAAEVLPDQWRQVIETNLTGAFWISQAAAIHMIPRRAGKIIHIASATTAIGLPRRVAYGASKGGLGQLVRSLAAEWSSKGIQVNAIAPGFFHTDLNDALFQDAKWRENLLSRIPAGRPGKSNDLDGALLFLAGSASDYVCGHILYVDGGYTRGDTI